MRKEKSWRKKRIWRRIGRRVKEREIIRISGREGVEEEKWNGVE